MEWNTIITVLIGLIAGWLLNETSSFISSRRENKKILKECFYTMLKIKMITSSLYDLIKDYKSLKKPNEFQQDFVNSIGKSHIDDFKKLKVSLMKLVKDISQIDPFFSYELESFSYLEDLSDMAISFLQDKDYKGRNPMEAFSPKILKYFISKLAFKISIWFWLYYSYNSFKQRKYRPVSLIKVGRS